MSSLDCLLESNAITIKRVPGISSVAGSASVGSVAKIHYGCSEWSCSPSSDGSEMAGESARPG